MCEQKQIVKDNTNVNKNFLFLPANRFCVINDCRSDYRQAFEVPNKVLGLRLP